MWDGRAFWFELKVSKGNSVNLSPHQVAWNTAYWARGGSGSGLTGSRFNTVQDLFIYLDKYFMEKKRGAEAPRI